MAHEVPTPLRSLDLYAADPVLCAEWPGLIRRGEEAFPGLDLIQETRMAHGWEYEQPPSRKKKVRSRFLWNWWKRAYDDKGGADTSRQQPPPVQKYQPRGKTVSIDELRERLRGRDRS